MGAGGVGTYRLSKVLGFVVVDGRARACAKVEKERRRRRKMMTVVMMMYVTRRHCHCRLHNRVGWSGRYKNTGRNTMGEAFEAQSVNVEGPEDEDERKADEGFEREYIQCVE